MTFTESSLAPALSESRRSFYARSVQSQEQRAPPALSESRRRSTTGSWTAAAIRPGRGDRPTQLPAQQGRVRGEGRGTEAPPRKPKRLLLITQQTELPHDSGQPTNKPTNQQTNKLPPQKMMINMIMTLYKTKTLMTRLGSSLCCDVPYVAVLQFPIVKKNIMICNNNK